MSRIFFSPQNHLEEKTCGHCNCKFWTHHLSQERKFCSLKCRWNYARTHSRRKVPTCHPERKYYGRGYCRGCWHEHWSPDWSKAKPAKCHPDRPNQGRGLCLNCYNSDRRANGDSTRSRLRYQYGITVERYRDLLATQGNRCGICGRDEEDAKNAWGRKSFSVDHSHKVGLVRGILCHRCNLGLGHFMENPWLLAKAIAYLADHPGVRPDASPVRGRKTQCA